MQGVIAAVPTPLDAAGAPIRDLFVEHCEWALANGCDGLNILGSTGEANSLGFDARKQVMTWAAQACPKERLMVGTGTPALSETIALTKAADDLGYGVALVLPPYYYTPVSDEGMIAWYLALHQALGSRNIQIYFYNFPQMTGIPIPVPVISALVEKAPQRFAGIKDSSGDLDYCRSVLAACPDLRVFPSSETALAEAHVDGYAGCISASVNATAPLAGAIWAARDNPPADLCVEIARQRGLFAGPRLIPSVKAQVAARTGEAAWCRVLPPFLPLSEADQVALTDQL